MRYRPSYFYPSDSSITAAPEEKLHTPEKCNKILNSYLNEMPDRLVSGIYINRTLHSPMRKPGRFLGPSPPREGLIKSGVG